AHVAGVGLGLLLGPDASLHVRPAAGDDDVHLDVRVVLVPGRGEHAHLVLRDVAPHVVGERAFLLGRRLDLLPGSLLLGGHAPTRAGGRLGGHAPTRAGGRLAGRARRGRAGGRSGPAAGGQQQRAGGGGQEGAAGDGGGRHRHVLHRSLFACHYRSIG